MKFVKLLCILITVSIDLTYGKKKFVFQTFRSYHQKWLQPLLNKVINDVRPQQLIIYIGDNLRSSEGLHNCIGQEISKLASTVLVKVPAEYKPKNMQTSKGKVMNIIFLKEKNIESYEWALEYISFRAPVVPRPKTIIFIIGKSVHKKFEPKLKKLLIESWKMKFLDATFIYVHENFKSPPSIFSYNPFANKFDIRFADQTTVLFSEKLKNMFGYKLIFGRPRGSLDPKILEEEELFRFHPQYSIDMKEGSYTFAKHFLSKMMNFTLTVKCQNNGAIDLYYDIYALTNFDSRKLVTNRPNDILYAGAAIPHLRVGELTSEYDSFTVIYYLLVVFSFSVFIKLMVKALKLNHRQWEDSRCLACIFGMRISTGNGLKERAFYFVIISLAFYISNDLVSVVTNMELDTGEKTIENFKDLDNMKVPIYSAMRVSYDYRDGDVNKRLINKTTIGLNDFEAIDKCFSELHSNNDRICMEEMRDIHLMSANLKHDIGSAKGFRTARFYVKAWFPVGLLGGASPYVHKFDTIILQSIEFGLIKRPTIKQRLNCMKREYDNEDYDISDYDTRIFYKSLLYFLFVGLIFGACVFLCEVLYKTYLCELLEKLSEIWTIYRNRNVKQDIELSDAR